MNGSSCAVSAGEAPDEAAIARVLARIPARAPRHVGVACVDWDGRLRAKELSPARVADALRHGTAFTTAIFATDTAGIPMEGTHFQDPAQGFPDARLVFDAGSARADPAAPSRLLLLGRLAGSYAEMCPRALLAREEDRLRALGCTVHAAYEVECHVLAETPEALAERAPHTLRSHPEFRRMLSFVGQRGAAPLFDDLVRTAEAIDIDIDSLHVEHEGLLEAALAPTGAREAADRLTLFKAMTKVVARRHGALATFMARLSDAHAPAGAHVNLSLRAADGAPLFWDAAAPDRLGTTLRRFLGGLQQHLPDLFLLCAPTLNSWKRYTGPAFVGRRNTWGIDNKTAAFRVVNVDAAHTRIEIRLTGADVNPHLALAAILAAGRRGIADNLPPSLAASGDAGLAEAAAGPSLPADFATAIRRWRTATVAAETFGSAFVAAYAGTRDWQLARFGAAVTDWEVRQFAESL